MDEAHERLSAHIRYWAKKRRITLTHLPDRAGVGATQFFDVLAGRKSPTLRFLVYLAKALEVDVSELLVPRPDKKK